MTFIFAAGFLCKLETGCDFLRFFRPNRCRNPPYTVLFARKQTDTEGESYNIEMTEAVKNIRFRTNLPPIFKSR